MACITCTDLAVGYSGKPVASGIGFSVSAGDMLCVVGENGAGKSTLVKTLLGLVPPVSGSFEFGDGLAPGEVGYLPQQSDAQRDFPASVWEIALSGRLPRIGSRPFYSRADRQAAQEALRKVGIDDLKNRPYGELSGGQQQRVLLARSLCAASRLIVLDEPTTGLDPDAAASLYDVLDELRADGMAVIAITHDVDEALRHATHVLRIDGTSHHAEPVGGEAAREGGAR